MIQDIFCIYVLVICAACVDLILSETSTLYWSVEDHVTGSSCIYTIVGDPTDWVPTLELDAEIIADPICVDGTDIKIGPLTSNPVRPGLLLSYDRVDNGIMYLDVTHDGDVQVFFPATTSVTGIAMDNESQNIYYIDSYLGLVLMKFTLTTKPYFTVLLPELEQARSIMADPNQGYLFWIEGSTLVRSDMVGGSMQTILPSISTSSLPTLDLDNQRLVLLDEEEHTITLYEYDGTLIDYLVNDTDITLGLFSGITIYQGYIFATMTDSSTLVIWNMTDGVRVADLGFSLSSVTQYGITVASNQSITPNSACQTDNGGCAHICIHQLPSSRICKCSFGYTLDGDGTSCLSAYITDKFLLATDIGADRLYQVGLETEEVHTIPIETTFNQRLEAVVYDSRDNAVIWIDTGNGTLRRKELVAGSSETVMIAFDEGSVVEGLTIDPWERNIYYADSTTRRIGKMNLDTLDHEILLTLPVGQSPFRLKVDYARGFLYWTNVGDTPTIERATLDGSVTEVLVHNNSELENPTGLAIDINAGKVYWADEGKQRIEAVDVDGSNRYMIATSPDIFSLELDSQYIYSARPYDIRRFMLSTTPQSTMGPKVFSVLGGLHVYSSASTVTSPTPPTPTTAPGGANVVKESGLVLPFVVIWMLMWCYYQV